MITPHALCGALSAATIYHGAMTLITAAASAEVTLRQAASDESQGEQNFERLSRVLRQHQVGKDLSVGAAAVKLCRCVCRRLCLCDDQQLRPRAGSFCEPPHRWDTPGAHQHRLQVCSPAICSPPGPAAASACKLNCVVQSAWHQCHSQHRACACDSCRPRWHSVQRGGDAACVNSIASGPRGSTTADCCGSRSQAPRNTARYVAAVVGV